VDSSNGAQNIFRNASDLTSDLIVGKKYRLTVDAKYTGGAAGSKLQLALAGSNTDFATLTTSLVTYTHEFTTDTAAGGALRMAGMGTGNVVTIDNWYLREIGCVADYDLAFAQPEISTMVQDRAGAADGTSSASGVTQCTPIEQLNSKSARIGTSAATPADGDLLVSGAATVGGLVTPSSGTNGEMQLGLGTALVTGAGTYDTALRWNGSSGNMLFSAGAAERMRISSAGTVTINTAADGLGLNFTGRNAGQDETWLRFYQNDGTTAQGGILGSNNVGLSLTGPSLSTVAAITDAGLAVTGAVTTTGNVGVGVSPSHMVHAESTGTDKCEIVASDATGTFKAVLGVQNAPGVAQQAYVGSLSNTSFKILTNGVSRVVVGTDGISTFSSGIAFSSQTDAAGTGITSGATTLDHYETGEWTPKYTSTGATWTTYHEQVGRYTRIGNTVYFNGRLRVNAAPTGTVSNSAIIDGLPFPSLNVVGTESAVAVGLQTFATTLSPSVQYNATTITVYKSNTTSQIIASETTATFFMFSGHYIAQ
jgi:hypothetical protein